jgi:two-component system cell cycle response regulator
MPRILTVDDSRAVRMIVTKQVRELGYDVEEAEDGLLGLALMEVTKFDLVILDVTMPVLDGPGMLARLRERGDETPILMLTSESKRSIVAGLMKLGINDYILKPFKAEELRAKILRALKQEAPAKARGASPAETADAASSPPAPSVASAEPTRDDGTGAKPIDLLVVDDMENVQKRLRQLLPEHLTLAGALTGPSALGLCRERTFRIILVDSEMPDVNTASLVKSLRLLQPNAALALLSLRTAVNVQAVARELGLDSLLFKPFTPESVEEFLGKHFDNQELVSNENEVVRVAPFKGRDDRLPAYFLRVSSLAIKTLDEIAAACFAEAIVDLTRLPAQSNKAAALVVELGEHARKVGVELRIVGSPAVIQTLRQYSDTATMKVFSSIEQARGTGAAA